MVTTQNLSSVGSDDLKKEVEVMEFHHETNNDEEESEEDEKDYPHATMASYVYKHKRVVSDLDSSFRSRAETMQESWTERGPMMEAMKIQML